MNIKGKVEDDLLETNSDIDSNKGETDVKMENDKEGSFKEKTKGNSGFIDQNSNGESNNPFSLNFQANIDGNLTDKPQITLFPKADQASLCSEASYATFNTPQQSPTKPKKAGKNKKKKKKPKKSPVEETPVPDEVSVQLFSNIFRIC